MIEAERIQQPYETRGGAELLRVHPKGTVTFRLSDRSLDAHGTRFNPDGIQTERFASNPIVLYGHDHAMENIIGRAVDFGAVDVERSDGAPDRAFDITVEFAPRSVSSRADDARKLVEAGFLRGASLGARVLKARQEKAHQRGAPPVTVFEESELLEASIVAVPSNPNTLALARAYAPGFDSPESTLDADGLEEWIHDSRSREAAPAEAADTAVGWKEALRNATDEQVARARTRSNWEIYLR